MEKSYEICISFSENENSIDFFNNVSKLLLSINSLNNALCNCLNTQIETKIMLDSVESGSIKVFLRDTLSKIPDEEIRKFINSPKEVIKDKIADFIIKAKYKFLETLKNKPNLLVNSADEIIISTIQENGLSAYGYSIKKPAILKAISDISQNTKGFIMPPTMIFQGKAIALSGDYIFDPSEIEGITEQTSEFQGSFIIKKPDLAGTSKWTIIHGKAIDVKIIDEDWRKKLQNHEVVFGCGDKIKGTLITKTFIDQELDVIDTNYYLDNIKGIETPISIANQKILF